MKAKLLFVLLLGTLATGCATKHYGRQGELTEHETSALECREVDLEIAKVSGFIARVERESEFSVASVFSFFGDFGIGNLMEKSAALRSAEDRLRQLQTIRSDKC